MSVAWRSPQQDIVFRPLRIAIVTEYYYPHIGGICEHVHFFAREARALGHHVDIITSNIGTKDSNNAQSDIGVIRLGHSISTYANGSQARFTLGIGLRRELRQVLNRGNYDIVHVHSPLSPVLPVLAIEEAQCPVVGTFHTYFDHSYAYQIGRKYFQNRLNMLQATIAVSPSTVIALERYFEADWQIIPNGVDTTFFVPEAPAPPHLRTDIPSILFLGRFDPRNGLASLINAFKRLRGNNRQVQLIVVGDGPLRSHYHKLANGDPAILFEGSILDKRPGYYANSTIYACPTTKASFGITLLESMACATPIVCSDILGFRDVVRHAREAWMVPSENDDALTDALATLLDDEPLRVRLGTRGYEEAQQYGWPAVTNRILDLYNHVLGRSSSTSQLISAVAPS